MQLDLAPFGYFQIKNFEGRDTKLDFQTIQVDFDDLQP
jgi:hypothetical protein